ncbi:MAG TPA: PaaI family thioesterase [Chloroflexia bacterium]|nr:PaaI family thioesterase [Chloroflexia bacterium]
MADLEAIPAGFKPLFRNSPFLENNGPFYYREEEGGFTIGLLIAEKHTNARGIAHGGILMAMADIALGYNAAYTRDPPLQLVTSSMTTDFASSARLGDWVEARVNIQKTGQRMVFANAYLSVGVERIVRASAVFAVVSKD